MAIGGAGMGNGANFTQRGFILGALIGAMLRSLGTLGLRHQPEFFLGSTAPGPRPHQVSGRIGGWSTPALLLYSRIHRPVIPAQLRNLRRRRLAIGAAPAREAPTHGALQLHRRLALLHQRQRPA